MTNIIIVKIITNKLFNIQLENSIEIINFTRCRIQSHKAPLVTYN